VDRGERCTHARDQLIRICHCLPVERRNGRQPARAPAVVNLMSLRALTTRGCLAPRARPS
jgi:hypothetical protein